MSLKIPKEFKMAVSLKWLRFGAKQYETNKVETMKVWSERNYYRFWGICGEARAKCGVEIRQTIGKWEA